MTTVVYVFLVLLCVAISCFIGYLTYTFLYDLDLNIQYKKLQRNKCIGENIDFDFFKEFNQVLAINLLIQNFKITYFKDEKIVVKIKKNYFCLADDCSLIFLFNEDSLLVNKMKKSKKILK